MKRFIYGVGQGVYSTVLQRYAIGADTAPCRVCGRDLVVGDHVLAHDERTGYGCVTCGWATLADVENEAAWREMMRPTTERVAAPDMASVRRLALLGVVSLDHAKHKISLTECGLRLVREAKARRAA